MSIKGLTNFSQKVRESAKSVMSQASHLQIDTEALPSAADWLYKNREFKPIDQISFHPTSKDLCLEDHIKFYFVIDTINFCFWPTKGIEYKDICKTLAEIFKSNENFFTFEKMKSISFDQFKEKMGHLFQGEGGMLEERFRLLKETFEVVETFGSFLNFVKTSDLSAQSFLSLIVQYLPGFQDHSFYKNRQVFFYKRAQILVCDVEAAMQAHKEVDPSTPIITDVDSLTCFADYRVPQGLWSLGVIKYDDKLAETIRNCEQIKFGSEEEVEIRSAMIVSVGLIAAEVNKKYGTSLTDRDVDWIFWQTGEENLKDSTEFPFHKTMTIFY